MGKTTLCSAIMGLVPVAGGSIEIFGHNATNKTPNAIVGLGVGYVPQGRRVWPSLTVDEHLNIRASKSGGEFTAERIYEMFPRLAERRNNGGNQLSGGEQQMLAIGRALLTQPKLLVMDEPTEGLAPAIVEQVIATLKDLARNISVLLIEQNIGVACDVADQVQVMVNGEIARVLSSAELARDPELQRRLIGVSAHGDESEAPDDPKDAETALPNPMTIWGQAGNLRPVKIYPPTQWDNAELPPEEKEPEELVQTTAHSAQEPADFSVASVTGRAAYVVGTFDTKGRELLYIKSLLDRRGMRTVTVDLSTSERPAGTTISARQVARHHPKGESAVFTGDRGSAVSEMAKAFEKFLVLRTDLGGVISAGGSGGTSLATPAMRGLPIGIPKVMVSTLASGDVGAFVGPSDITMMYSVTDVQGLNRISERILGNAANALAGMIGFHKKGRKADRPALGMTMFGVTTSCVQQIEAQLNTNYECLIFHATGMGGRSMEKLADEGELAAVMDITTTEVADKIVGGLFAASDDRFGAVIRTGLPYVGSVGAVDMVNFMARDTVPARFEGRKFYIHNPQVTLMRTTTEENREIGQWIASRLNEMPGPVRFLLPMGGVSAIDAPGLPFHDPEADAELFSSIEETFRNTDTHQLIRVNANINEPDFADAAVRAFREIAGSD